MAKDIFKRSEEADIRQCDWPGCTGEGEHRAPRSRNALREYFWFCLDHVRAYNKSWNYYVGMDEDEIEADMRRDTVWQRETWKLGTGPAFAAATGRFEFGFDVDDPSAQDAERPVTPQVDNLTARALTTFGLDLPTDEQAIKSRYKELVKRHHPDTNGGTKAAEEEFKKIQEAYRTLMDFLSPEGPAQRRAP